MAKLYLNTRDELVCLDTDKIALVQANGNYSRIIYITKRDIMVTMGISKLEEVLKSFNHADYRYLRLGRSFIVNHAYLQKIDLLKQQLVLSDNDKNDIRISLPKHILKAYKGATANSIKLKEERQYENNYSGTRGGPTL
jgi:DNA-binding LytR/AlgR family response regulator